MPIWQWTRTLSFFSLHWWRNSLVWSKCFLISTFIASSILIHNTLKFSLTEESNGQSHTLIMCRIFKSFSNFILHACPKSPWNRKSSRTTDGVPRDRGGSVPLEFISNFTWFNSCKYFSSSSVAPIVSFRWSPMISNADPGLKSLYMPAIRISFCLLPTHEVTQLIYLEGQIGPEWMSMKGFPKMRSFYSKRDTHECMFKSSCTRNIAATQKFLKLKSF